MNRNPLPIAACLVMVLTLAGLSRIQAEPTEPPPTTPIPAVTPRDSTSTNQEEFAALRDPFWPPGYTPQPATVTPPSGGDNKKPGDKPTAVKPPVGPVDPKTVVWPKLIWKGRMGNIAILGNGIGGVSKGEIVKLVRDGYLFRWRIDDITKDGVKYTQLDVTPKR